MGESLLAVILSGRVGEHGMHKVPTQASVVQIQTCQSLNVVVLPAVPLTMTPSARTEKLADGLARPETSNAQSA